MWYRLLGLVLLIVSSCATIMGVIAIGIALDPNMSLSSLTDIFEVAQEMGRALLVICALVISIIGIYLGFTCGVYFFTKGR